MHQLDSNKLFKWTLNGVRLWGLNVIIHRIFTSFLFTLFIKQLYESYVHLMFCKNTCFYIFYNLKMKTRDKYCFGNNIREPLMMLSSIVVSYIQLDLSSYALPLPNGLIFTILNNPVQCHFIMTQTNENLQSSFYFTFSSKEIE